MGPRSSPARSASISMAKTVALYFGLVAFGSTSVWGLQVSPNSPCASVCMNNPTQDPSDPNNSNTLGSEIVCNDDDYTFNPVGQKYETCLNCLQNSTAVASGESDQAWYLYNLRFSFNTCIFGATNATDPITTPCALNTDCGPIQGAMLDGMDNPETLQEFSYCSAYDNSFLGTFLGTCGTCLEETTNQVIFSNFLTALHAGCLQQPKPGDLIGLNGTVFTKNQVQITSPIIPTSSSHKVMTPGVIIGIAIAGSVVLLATLAILFICIRKRHNSNRLKQFNSPLDSRFGAKNITAPNRGAFASPRHSPPLSNKESMPMKRTPRPLNFSRHARRPRLEDVHEQAERTPLTAPPEYSPVSPPDSSRSSILPKHAAYIPHEFTPPSRNSFVPSARNSASYAPSALTAARNSGLSNVLPPPPPRPPPAGLPQRPASTITGPSRVSTVAVEPEVTRNPSNASRLSKFHAREASVGTVGRTRDPSVGSTRRTRDTSVGSTRRFRDTSVGRRARDTSVGRRARDTSVGRRARDTSVGSIGRVREESRERNNATPVSISGPIIRVGNRFESDAQAREARKTLYLRGLSGTISHDPNSKEMEERSSPESAKSIHSTELWPGNY